MKSHVPNIVLLLLLWASSLIVLGFLARVSWFLFTVGWGFI